MKAQIEIKVAEMGIEIKNLDKNIKEVKSDVKEIKSFLFSEDSSGLAEKMAKCYVKKEEFDPVKKVVYMIVSLVLIAVFTALIRLVVLAK